MAKTALDILVFLRGRRDMRNFGDIKIKGLAGSEGILGEFRGLRNPKPQTPNPKPKTQNPKPQTLNPKPQTPNPKP